MGVVLGVVLGERSFVTVCVVVQREKFWVNDFWFVGMEKRFDCCLTF